MSDPPSAYIVNPYEVGGSPKVKPCIPQGIGRGGRKRLPSKKRRVC